ncbi:hypothetical protein [Parvularcula dongshanensis]|uniref:Uncharacterized protein n=1 Tax=Parvularcula dongshanensis TaxID=1173995 RepID=A0A840I149_9PROT|nr:hypothetical protein [Parvularcula dongshanensis]MBB4657918.1 hypothetical protein [Parvularcula dongshanensis]
MTQTTQDDLAYLRAVTDAARSPVLLGGRFLVMWGGFLATAYTAQWAILSGVAGVGSGWIAAVWLAFGVGTGTGMAVLTRGIRRKPGRGSAAATVESTAWSGAGFAIFAYAGSLIVAFATGNASPLLFDTIAGVAFALYGTAFLVTAAAARQRWMRAFAVLSFAGAAVVPWLAGRPLLYLVSAFFILAVAVTPGLILIRREPANLPDEAGV